MSRSAEEQQLLDQRIQAMKLKNEELKRRHMEVEADKQSAAKQNALVKMTIPHDDDWVPGRHDDSPRQDRNYPQSDASNAPPAMGHEGGEDRSQRRNRNDGYRDDGYTFTHHQEDSTSGFRPNQNAQNFSGRRNDYQGSRQRSNDDRYQSGEGRRFGDWSVRMDGRGGRARDWGSGASRGYRNDASSGDAARGPATFTSKVFKNSSIDPDRGKRPSYRLAEGDGPPPDPSYSFLGDSMRDSPDSSERRRGHSDKRGFPRGRGRGGQTWNNRAFHDSRTGGFEERADHDGPRPKNRDGDGTQSYEAAWRRERNIIDQERINRQKTSDGNWSREWDNNKSFTEPNERSQRWRRGNTSQNYERSYNRRGHQYEEGQAPKQTHMQWNNHAPNTSSHDSEHEQQSRNKFIRRGRFSNQNRFKDNSELRNGSERQPAEIVSNVKDANVKESGEETVEQMQVPEASGTSKRCVEEVGGKLRVSMSTVGESAEGASVDSKRARKDSRKNKRSRIRSTTSTGTTGAAEDDDGSWEDMSSDEDISVLAELQKAPQLFAGTSSKTVDVSSGPESLDPIPAPGKEDEFLWDDFHPAGFQDNVVDLDAEAAFQALLDEKAKQEVSEESVGNSGSQPPKVSFRLDTACLEDSSDEGDGLKLDPLLVTTQIVQAEVDCMSLTSIPTDSSLPEEVCQLAKTISAKNEKIPEEEGSNSVSEADSVSAEELSGPVAIMDVKPVVDSHVVTDDKLPLSDKSLSKNEESDVKAPNIASPLSSDDKEEASNQNNSSSKNEEPDVKAPNIASPLSSDDKEEASNQNVDNSLATNNSLDSVEKVVEEGNERKPDCDETAAVITESPVDDKISGHVKLDSEVEGNKDDGEKKEENKDNREKEELVSNCLEGSTINAPTK